MSDSYPQPSFIEKTWVKRVKMCKFVESGNRGKKIAI